MGKVKKSKFDNKFKSITPKDIRKSGVKKEKEVFEELPKLSLNFKDFDQNQCPPGQTFEDWQENGLLATLMKNFVSVCMYNRMEAEQQKILKVYGSFPQNSEYKIPKFITGDVEWGTIQRIGGQKPRLAGYIIGSIFYPVFLDKDHKFYPTKK